MSQLRGSNANLIEINRAIVNYLNDRGALDRDVRQVLARVGVSIDVSNEGRVPRSELTALQRRLRREPEVQVDTLRQEGYPLIALEAAIANRSGRMTQSLLAALNSVGIKPEQAMTQDISPGSNSPMRRFYDALQLQPDIRAYNIIRQRHNPEVVVAGIQNFLANGIPLSRDLESVAIPEHLGMGDRTDRGENSWLRRLMVELTPSAAARNARRDLIPTRQPQQTPENYALEIRQTRSDLDNRAISILTGLASENVEHAIKVEKYAAYVAIHDGLRALDLHKAATLGFENGKSECMFGETLSLENPHQRVVLLSARPVSEGVPENVVFVDMNDLAKYVGDQHKHPLTNERISTPDDLGKYLMRIGPDEGSQPNAEGASTSQ